MALSNTTVKAIYQGDASNRDFAIPFTPIVDDSAETKVYELDESDPLAPVLTLQVEGAGNDYTLVGAPDADSFHTTVRFNTGNAPAATTKVIVARNIALTQTVDMSVSGFRPTSVELALDKLTALIQQHEEMLSRVPLMDIGENLGAPLTLERSPAGGEAVMWNATGDGFEAGPTADEIELAQGYAVAAGAARTAAEAAQTAAEAAETAAALSASAAAATLASAFYRDVIYVTNADSPIAPVQAQNGYMYVIDSSGGAITINLPQISSLTLPFNVAFLMKAAGNNVTINRAGTDTIMGATSKVLDTAGVGVHFVADNSAAPDDWSVTEMGTVADLSITQGKLAQQVFNALTTVTPVAADSFPIADASDSGNKKKAAIAAIRNAVYRSVTTTDSVGVDDETMKLSGASFTSTLPTAVGVAGKRYKFIHAGTSLTQKYTLATTSAQTIGGVASGSYVLCTNGEVLEIESDGANWIIVTHWAVTDWIDGGAITVEGSTSNPSKGSNTIVIDKFRYRRVGQMLHGRFEYKQTAVSGSSAGSGDYLLTAVPSNAAIDTSKLTVFTTIEGVGAYRHTGAVGVGGGGDTVSTAASGSIVVYDSTRVRIFAVGDLNVGCIGSGYFPLNDANTFFFGDFMVPITDWQP